MIIFFWENVFFSKLFSICLQFGTKNITDYAIEPHVDSETHFHFMGKDLCSVLICNQSPQFTKTWLQLPLYIKSFDCNFQFSFKQNSNQVVKLQSSNFLCVLGGLAIVIFELGSWTLNIEKKTIKK